MQSGIGNLRPATTYYVRLIVTAPADTYRTGVQTLGPIVSFTTPPVGSLHLHSARLPVKRGHAQLALDCRAPVACTTQLSLIASHTTGSGRHRHRATSASIDRDRSKWFLARADRIDD